MSVVTLLCFPAATLGVPHHSRLDLRSTTRPSCICSHRKLFFHDDAMNMCMGGYVAGCVRGRARGLGAVARR